MSRGSASSSSYPRPTLNPRRHSMLPIAKLEELVGQPDSGIVKVNQPFHLALKPLYLGNINLGLVTYFNKHVGIYSPKLDGILAGYGKLYLKSPTGSFINDESPVHLDVISDFWLFRPVVGSQLLGVVNKKSPAHVSCLVHGCFNVPCYRPHDTLVQEWCGAKAKLQQVVRFTVIKADMTQRIPFIVGDLQSVDVETPVMAEDNVHVISASKWDRMRNKNALSDSDSGIDSAGRRKKNSRGEREVNSVADEVDTTTDSSKKKKKKKSRKEKEDSPDDDVFVAAAEEPSRKSKKRRRAQEDDEILESVQNDQPCTSSSFTSPQAKKKRRTTEEDMQSSLLSDMQEKHTKAKKKKKKRDREKEEEEEERENATEIKVEVEDGDAYDDEATSSKRSRKGERKRQNETAEIADLRDSIFLSSVQVQIHEDSKKRKKSSKKKNRVQEEEEEEQDDKAALQASILSMNESANGGDEIDRRESLILKAIANAPLRTKKAKNTSQVEVKSEPLSPIASPRKSPRKSPEKKSPSKKSKGKKSKTAESAAACNGSASLDVSAAQELLIQSMMRKLPGSSRKK